MFRSLSWTLPTIEQLYAEVRRWSRHQDFHAVSCCLAQSASDVHVYKLLIPLRPKAGSLTAFCYRITDIKASVALRRFLHTFTALLITTTVI
jgi:hypothetical protein